MSVAGIIFSNLHDKNIPELTRQRTMASVPFGCRYRLVDFALSNMVNSGIKNVSVITHYNYHSLMEHIGSGKDWDLARRSGGIRVLPPFITAYANGSNVLYNSRLEALKSINHSINQMTEDYVVLSDCDAICNIDINNMLRAHIDANSDITIATKSVKLTRDAAQKSIILESDIDGNITDVIINPKNFEGQADINLNIWIINRRYLNGIVLDSIAHGYTSFSHDILARNIGKRKFRVYRYDGYFAAITSLEEYFRRNMEILKTDVRNQIFGIAERPILTKVRNSAPTRYGDNAKISNSLIADGCMVEGIVENSVLFRGVKVKKGAIVKNSVLFQDNYIGENASLNCVISDKNAIIRDSTVLSGHKSRPYYIEKGKML